MKQGKSLIVFVMVLFALAIICYLGYHIFETFQEPFTTTYAYEYELNDSIEVEGLLVRQEKVLAGTQGILDVTRGEGEQVGVGQTVAHVYRDDQARLAQEQQDALNMEMAQLQYAIGQGGDAASVAQVDQEILNSIAALRGATALNDYSQLEDQVMDMKSNVLRRAYAYGADLTSDDLVARLQELKNQYTTLQSQTYAAVTQVTAPASGTFSNLVDGYETLISLETAGSFTPSMLEELLQQPVSGAQNTAGKIITKNNWYFVAVVSKQDAERLEQEKKMTLRFASDFVQDIPVTLEQVGTEEQGNVVVIVSTDRYLEQTTLLRKQAGELIFDSDTGIRVPKIALRMVTNVKTDPETGETTEEQKVGIYVLTAGKAEFKVVEILAEGEDFYLVQSVDQGKKRLRTGDEVIVQATDLYDGKLLEVQS